MHGPIATYHAHAPHEPEKNSCGSCTRCIVACPTGAISPEGGIVDARLCISYQTIENRGPIPRELRSKFGDWIFGCDACLDACPVGASNHTTYPEFVPPTLEYARPALAPLLELDDAAFLERYRGRPIMRAKRDGFLRNVCIALGNTGALADLNPLIRALDDRAPLVRGHAAWAAAHLITRLSPSTADLSEAKAALEARLQTEQDPWVNEELTLAIAALHHTGAPPHPRRGVGAGGEGRRTNSLLGQVYNPLSPSTLHQSEHSP
jgi:epoxyqueuosine reductase